ncbi:hypothetical protein E8E11_009933 [Didymella keratinophila]|nr:hypothetical protein E8E11_009933 [Didymella keratinophila]
MEPRIATLLDQQPYKRLTLDPSVLSTSSSGAPRYIEPSSGVRAGHPQADSHSDHDHVDTRHKASSQAHSGAPLARVLNDSAASPLAFQSASGRVTPQNVSYQTRSDVLASGPLAISPDAPRRDEQSNVIGYPGGDASLIQLPKPPQAPRKTAKRPRIPPLLQGLHQPPPLPPKNKLFPPISERSGPGNDVGDRLGLTSTFSTGSTEKLAEARASPEKRHRPAIADVEQVVNLSDFTRAPREQGASSENTPEPSPAIKITDRAQNKAKKTRKRTKWSQKETEDLLSGVSRYGIGRWKQILECADFNFQGRTAVDLKDRFRVCRPGEGLKARNGTKKQVLKNPRSANTGYATSEATSQSAKAASTEASVPAHDASTEDNITDGPAVSKPEEYYGSFPKSNRRERRHFNDEDDRNLLKGFKRYGTRWRAMRDDLELGFDMRHPTDLRDRFRIRYPEEFAKAGFKLKPKEARELGEAGKAKTQKTQVSRLPSPTMGRTTDASDPPVARASAATAPVAALMPASATASKASIPTSIRRTFDLVTDLAFDDDEGEEGERSPIVLNRNILQWADENSTTLPTTTAASTNTQIPSLPPSDFLLNPFAVASDGLHINPLATLKLPSTAHWSYMNPPSTNLFATPSLNSTAAAPPALPPPAPFMHLLPVNNSTSATATRAQQDMRTPNLPNIVFPYVPNASARNAVHNLPAPADILSERQPCTGDGFKG